MSSLLKRIPKDFRKEVRSYVDSGMLKLKPGSRHLKLCWSDGRKTTVPGSPSDHRALQNFKSELRRSTINPD